MDSECDSVNKEIQIVMSSQSGSFINTEPNKLENHKGA